MTTAPRSTKYRVLLLLCLTVLAVLTCAAAFAAADPIDVTVSVSPDTLSAPGDVTVSVRVTNVSNEDLAQAVSLYDPAGKPVTVFGDGGSAMFKQDEFRTVQMTWAVTKEELDAGELTFTAKYGDKSVSDSAKLTYTGESVSLQISRALSPEVVRTGNTASVVYELFNAGNVDLTNIRVTENIASKKPQTVSTLKAGDRATLTFTAKMGSNDLKSSAKITYKVKGNTKTQTMNVDGLIIPVAVRGLDITLSADKTAVNIGDTVKLSMTVENKGNITYSDVTVTDAKIGDVFTGLTIPAGASFTEEKEVTVLEPTKYAFSVKLADNTGATNTLTTNDVPVSAYDPTKELRLTLLLTSEKETIESMPANVSMSLLVTNTSNVDCKNIAITQGTAAIYTIPELKAGQSTTLKRDYTLSQAGQFRFTAAAADAIGNAMSFDSNTLTIRYAAPTAEPTTVPVVTVAPLVTVAPAEFSDVDNTLRVTRNSLYTATWALGGLFAACLVLFLISTVVRAGKKRQSAQAYDHLELADKRDYTEPAPEDKPETDVPVYEEQQEEVTEESLPHEKLIKESEQEEEPDFDIPEPVPPEMLIKPEDVQKDEPEQPEVSVEPEQERPAEPPEGDGLGGYRMTRGEETAEPKEAPKPKDARRAAKRKSPKQDDGE